MLTPFRGAATGARRTGVALAVAALLAAPVAATAAPVPSAVRSAEVVGGPDLAARGVVVRPGPGSTPLPAVDADTWLVADITTGHVLAAKGAHTRVLPASTLKTLTAVTLMPKLDKEQVVTATWEQARADGGHVGIVPGGTYTVWDLWHGLLLPSANDAAAALADANGGMAATVRDMQAMAQRLRADDTVVRNDSGLDAKGQVSSAYDMALFARAALDIPDFRTVTKTFHYSFPGRPVTGAATRKTYQIYTQNRLLVHGYKGVIGGKTGFTSLAHRTYWGAASRGGHTLVVTLFQIHEPTEAAARKLLNWGFANLATVTPVGTLVAPLDTGSTPTSEPTAGAAAAGGGTTAAGGTTTQAGTGVPWAPIVLLALLVGAVAGFVLRRRRRPADAGALPLGTALDPAPTAPTPRPTRAAATTSPSVVVTSPGRPAASAAASGAASGATAGASSDAPRGATTAGAANVDDTAPVEVVRPPVPSVTAPGEPQRVEAVGRVPGVDGQTPADDAPAPPAPAPPAPAPSGGNVRVIRPPGRTPTP